MLGDLDGLRVLDLFAGTGALGIEALSRGAMQALFVEPEEAALSALAANLARLGLDPPQARVEASDAVRALQRASACGEAYDLIFIDPPWHERELWTELETALAKVLASGARVVVESDRRNPRTLAMPVQRERHYGRTSITIHSQP
jgi:16S rRNA (guanine966-N2)-methyltransferase